MSRAAALLRPGRAGANTATDHITVAQLTLAQLPKQHRRGRRTLVRTDSAGGTHAFLTWLTRRGRWLSYSVGMTITEQMHAVVARTPKRSWTPAYNADGQVREGAGLRLRLFSTAARLTRSGRQHGLTFAGHWPWTHLLLAAHDRLALLPDPG